MTTVQILTAVAGLVLTSAATIAGVLFGVWRMLAHYEARSDAAHRDLGLRIDATNARIDGVRTDLVARTDKMGADLVARIDGVSADLGARIDRVNADLVARIDKMGADLGARIDRVSTDLGARIDRTNARIDRTNERIDGLRSGQANAPTE